MNFFIQYMNAVWSELRRLILLGSVAIYMGLVGRSEFERGMMIVGVPLSLMAAGSLLIAVNFLRWIYEARKEARRRGQMLGKFSRTPEYKEFLDAYAAKMIRDQIKW